MSNFYSGSKIFEPVSDIFGLSVDQFNFIFCQVVACGFGYVFSRCLSADKFSATQRHIIQLITGVLLTIFCFGSQIWHLLAQSISVYIMMKAMSTKSARYFILGFVLLFLSVAHIARMYYDYGGYTMDITGPLMIQTQRLSSLAFNLHDGQRIKKKEPLRRDYHKKHALLEYPTLLEFFSYMFYFHGIMIGPFVFMADYLRFIEGRQHEVLDEKDHEHYKKNQKSILYGWSEIKYYSFGCLVYGVFTMFVQPKLELEYIYSEEYLNSSLLWQYLCLTVISFFIRQKYYFAWSIGTIPNLIAGLGFSGFNDEKEPQYDIVKNFDFWKIELGTSTKMIMENWNNGTMAWLRECVYDRMPRSKGTMAVFICSAIWHGYYPGYYLCFLSMSFFTAASRRGRRNIRPLFHSAGYVKTYDVITSLIGMLTMNYSAIAFVGLSVNQSIHVWAKMLYVVHVGAFALYFLSPFFGQKPSKTDKEVSNNNTTKLVTGDTEKLKMPPSVQGDDIVTMKELDVKNVSREDPTGFKLGEDGISKRISGAVDSSAS